MGTSSSMRRQLVPRRRLAWLFALALFLSVAPPLPVSAWDDPEPSTPIDFVRKDKIFLSPGGEPITTVAYGPDGRLYVGSMSGTIYALTLDDARNVVATQQIDTIASTPNFNEDGSPAPGVVGRLLLGMTFDPQSPPSQPVMYVAHSDPRLSYDAADPSTHLDVFSGTITRLTGPNFSSNRLDVITGLPRSRKNHGTNGLAFGPEGWLYIAQGGNTDLGAPHNTWGSLPEFYLSAAVLRADVRTMSTSLDVSHVDSASDLTPLQGDFELFATGFRNAYDLVWHTDGSLYVNENGANVFQGTTPGPADGCPTGEAVLPPEQSDLLLRVPQGMHAGHPNPARGQCVFRDGTIYNPDKAPDANYQPPLRAYGHNQGEVSMDGIIEYPTGAMAGNLVSATFSGTELLVRAIFNGDGTVTIARMDEYGAFDNPLDLAVDAEGVIYIAEFGLSGPAGVSVLIPENIVVPELTLTGINPTSGPPEGGTSVTLSGTLFANGASVTFDGIQATGVNVVNSTTITATTPAHPTGTVDVTVTNPDSESVTLVDGFAYTNAGGGTSVVRVNSGGGSYTGSTGLWSGDTGFAGGFTFSTNQSIAGTVDDALYQSERYGTFSYAFALQNGEYLVNLKFAEIYWTNAGQRVFDVTINGQTVLDNFDILSETTRLTALDKSFPVTVSNGTLTISFNTVVDNAKVSAIEITSGGNDTTPPTVSSTNPVNGAVDVPVQSSITVNFSEPMNKTATEAAFSLNPSHTGSFSWNAAGTSMTFTPLAAVGYLMPNELYSASVSTGALDLAGNALAANHDWTFTTGANDDTTPPTISAVSPANGATNVPVDSAINVTFSEAMDQAATQGAFSINPSVPGSFSWNPTGTTMTFTPTEVLAEGQLYAAAVSTGATDSAGNALASAFNWSFSTPGADPDPAPSLDTIDPTSGSTTGGTAVTLSGANFVNGATVSFGGTAATNVVVVNSSTITASTPAHSAGSVDVVVTNPDAQSATLAGGFAYTSSGGGSSLVRVNAGGGSYSAAGVIWSGDTGFSGGSFYSTNQPIAGTTDDALYQSERYGTFSYSFTLANGNYTVNLKFAEIYWTATGQRVFDVTINGQFVLDNFDILTQTSPLTALDKSFPVTVTNGTLTISFTTVVDNAKVSAIEILGSGGGDTTPPTVSATSPTNNATSVAVSANVSVTFSEAMNQAATEAAFSLSPSVPGSFSWNGAGTVLTFNPTSDLAANQLYAVTISTAAKDLAGNALASAFNWSFTTQSVAAPAPTLSGITPNSGSTAGGTAVTVSGANFVSGATVSVGGTAATNVVVVNSSTITASTPAHSAGSVDVVVTNPDAQSATLAGGFTYTSSGGSGVARVNSGGGSYTGTAGLWSGDNSFSGGSTYTTGQPIAGTSDDPLYQSERHGTFSYSFTLANGNYTVNLKFAEIYWTSTGKRIFDVTINGQLVLDNFDILTQTGPLTALDKSFPVSVTNGTLTIGFTTVVDNAKVSAIEILGDSGSGDTTPPAVSAVSPTNGATGVALDANLSVTFSEAMDQAATQGAFSINPGVPGSFSWNGAGTVLTFNPTNNLTANQLYAVTISTAAKDLAGNSMAANHNWSFTTATDTGEPGVGQWTTLPPLPEARSEVAVVETGGIIYVLAGGSSSGLSNKVFAYDPDSQTWDEVAPYPGPAVDHAGAAVVNGIIYLIGGLTGWPDAAVNTVYAYDPATDSWSQRANLPRDRGAMGVAVLGGKIYAAGGLVDGGTAVTDLAVYDPQTNIWTPLAPMPTARDHLTMEAVNGMLYALGGRPVTINAPVAANEAYDPNTNTWQARAPLPVARGGHGSAVLDGKIIVFGGEGNVGVPSGMFANTDEYDPISNSWRALAPMITPRHGMDGAVLEGVVYVPGGGVSQGGSQSTTHEAFSMLTQQSTLIQTTLTLVFLIALMLWLRWIGRRAEER